MPFLETVTTVFDQEIQIFLESLKSYARQRHLFEAGPLLEDWERVAGLPDRCIRQLRREPQGRLEDLISKLVYSWDGTVAQLYALLRFLGKAGSLSLGADTHALHLRVPFDTYVPFRCGTGRCSETLLNFKFLPDSPSGRIHCFLEHRAPAHLSLQPVQNIQRLNLLVDGRVHAWGGHGSVTTLYAPDHPQGGVSNLTRAGRRVSDENFWYMPSQALARGLQSTGVLANRGVGGRTDEDYVYVIVTLLPHTGFDLVQIYPLGRPYSSVTSAAFLVSDNLYARHGHTEDWTVLFDQAVPPIAFSSYNQVLGRWSGKLSVRLPETRFERQVQFRFRNNTPPPKRPGYQSVLIGVAGAKIFSATSFS